MFAYILGANSVKYIFSQQVTGVIINAVQNSRDERFLCSALSLLSGFLIKG